MRLSEQLRSEAKVAECQSRECRESKAGPKVKAMGHYYAGGASAFRAAAEMATHHEWLPIDDKTPRDREVIAGKYVKWKHLGGTTRKPVWYRKLVSGDELSLFTHYLPAPEPPPLQPRVARSA